MSDPFPPDPRLPHDRAVVGGPGFGAEWHYVEGFESAAQVLLTRIEDSGHDAHVADTLIFPLVFVCRHAIELRMKELIDVGSRYLGTEGVPTTHRLDALWSKCRAVILRQWPSTTPSALVNIEAIVGDFHAADPFSTAWRYPTDRSGDPSLPESLRDIRPRSVFEAMTTLCRALDAASTGVQAETEMADEHRREMLEALGDEMREP